MLDDRLAARKTRVHPGGRRPGYLSLVDRAPEVVKTRRAACGCWRYEQRRDPLRPPSSERPPASPLPPICLRRRKIGQRVALDVAALGKGTTISSRLRIKFLCPPMGRRPSVISMGRGRRDSSLHLGPGSLGDDRECMPSCALRVGGMAQVFAKILARSMSVARPVNLPSPRYLRQAAAGAARGWRTVACVSEQVVGCRPR